MNILKLMQLLTQAQELYKELETMGVVKKIEQAIGTEKEILQDLEQNQKLIAFLTEIEAFITQHPKM